ncbi:hypothetical protein GCM10011344_21860 [Dokdonia pacifica]|nr:hypothetical protein GCM10011344_21860 [Dokdonia pacifica]
MRPQQTNYNPNQYSPNSMKLHLFIFILLASVACTFAQSHRNTGSYNRIGLQGKILLTAIDSDNLDIDGSEGFQGGFTTRGRLYNNWGIVYGIDFISANVSVQGAGASQAIDNQIDYNFIGAQLNFLVSYNIIGQNLALDFGPALLVNGKMNLKDDGQADTRIAGFSSLTGNDLEEISKINPFAVIGLTGGFENVRLMVQYQYGVTNILNGLNKQDLELIDSEARDFKGTASFISAGVVFYL